MGYPRLSLLSALLIILPLNIGAQNRLDSIQHLDEVKVEARIKPNAEVIPSQKLSGAVLDGLNTHSVADAIRYFSGVQIKDYGGVGGIKTVDIRSMGSNQLGVFYDGIQLGNAQNGQIDLGKFSLDNLEEITLYNGQKSEIFQSAKDFGSAGSIYLRTKRPSFTGNKRNNFRFVFRTGSFGLANPSVLWEHRLNDKVTLSLNAEYIGASGKYKFRYKKRFSDGTLAWDTTATRQNGDINSVRAEAGAFGYMKDGKWTLKAYFYDSEKGIPGAIVNNVWKTSQRQWDRNFFAQGNFQKKINGIYEFQVNAKYAHDYMRYLNPDTTLMYLDNKFWQQEVYISTANKLEILPFWDINLSMDYQWNTLDATLSNFAYPTRNSYLIALASLLEWKQWKLQASALGTFIWDRYSVMGSGGEKQNKNSNLQKLTPAVFLSYKPWQNQDFNLRAFYKKIFRMPTFNDLYYTDFGNVDLKPEYATQYNIGAQYGVNLGNAILQRFNLTADGYYNIVNDKIIAVPKGTGQYRWMMMNIGKVKIHGIDVTGQLNLQLPYKIKINLNLNYTYQKALDFTDPSDNDPVSGTYKKQIAYIPKHSGSATVNGLFKNWDLNYSFIYVGERWQNSSNINANYIQPWYTHDISAGYGFSFNSIKMKATVEVNNLFNQQYEVIANYPMPGRNFKVILKLDI